ncbi:ATP cone domain-containing protein [Clostridium sp. LIBA-8841]|uniref:ATP cone domain-containing protein n=1 Tax=Clostridium sp. LIBA-8841 TaxID=2987530 RepID=UPI002AC4FF57|nr:ATP cone domain-containing protein [Clostridium sp. LIBA-8841]MDZ5252467.1 ATP cone domain-containing protein [Clostridium sp. LIBA-8841]
MNIIKKDGRIEEFKIEKLSTSLSNAANDLNLTLNKSDVKIITEDVEKIIKSIRLNNEATSSYEVVGVLISSLKDEKFSEILKAYIEYKK